VKGNRSRTRQLALALLSVAIAVPMTIRWVHQSSAILAAPSKASANVERVEGARMPVSASESHIIAMQPPETVVRQDGDGMEMQTMVANCAKGFVRRGSVCEAEAATKIMSSIKASRAIEQRSVRPPERE
jgi:hypothetical protein